MKWYGRNVSGRSPATETKTIGPSCGSKSTRAIVSVALDGSFVGVWKVHTSPAWKREVVAGSFTGPREHEAEQMTTAMRQMARGVLIRANVPDQRPGATDPQLSTRAASPGSLNLACWRAANLAFLLAAPSTMKSALRSY